METFDLIIILIDVNKDVKIADFDATVEIGSELLAGALPWAKEDAQGNCPQAGPETEQVSLGSCIFNIRYGNPPYAELESPSPTALFGFVEMHNIFKIALVVLKRGADYYALDGGYL